MNINYENEIQKHLESVAGSKNKPEEYWKEGNSITLDAMDLRELLRDAFFKCVRIAYVHGCADGNQEDVEQLKTTIKLNELLIDDLDIKLKNRNMLIAKLAKRHPTREEVLEQYDNIKLNSVNYRWTKDPLASGPV